MIQLVSFGGETAQDENARRHGERVIDLTAKRVLKETTAAKAARGIRRRLAKTRFFTCLVPSLLSPLVILFELPGITEFW